MVTTSRPAPRSAATSTPAGQTWRQRASELGWVLLPLRLFLGVTMVYAGFLKLSDRAYLDPTAPAGVARQMALAQTHSPISGLVGVTAQHATLFGLLIALGELAVGLGVLLGFWTRLSAFGGMLLALSFFLTVSWTTRPYFFGSDIVFLFAFSPLAIAGDGGVLSWGAAIRRSVRRDAGLPAEPSGRPEPAQAVATADRRALLQTSAAALGAGLLTVLGATVARAFSKGAPAAAPVTPPAPGGGPGSSPQATARPTPSSQPQPSASKPPGGILLGPASAVTVGSAANFTDPRTGQPGIIVQPKAGTFLAYSAVCTHQGCTVGFNGGQFACPCHGATFSAASGAVTGGPAPAPLARINVVEAGGKIYAV
jgi:thiosulfate dehydrogenase [quinone] large subunit